MKYTSTNFRLLFMVFGLVLFAFTSCVKEDFDAPPGDGLDPDIEANTTIAQLKQFYTTAGKAVQITDDLVLKAVVISDDREGNFYKSLVVQDSTAGILIRIDQPNLYTEYPTGRRVFVKCKGLWIGAYENLIQIGGTIDTITDPQAASIGYIPSAVVDNFILKGKYNIPVAPKVVAINLLNDSYQNMLIRLNDVEFDYPDAGQPYANIETKASVNRKIIDCIGNEILLRTSGYAKFAGDSTPFGNGSLTAVFSVFRTDYQLYINNTGAVDFTKPRCNVPVEPQFIDIADVRAFYFGNDISLPEGLKIRGTLISDVANGNVDARNLYFQDATAGIVVRISNNHSFKLWDELEIDISGLTLKKFNGLMQIDQTPNARITKVGVKAITPRDATISQIIANSESWQSTIVRIANVSITSSSGKYSGGGGNITLNDGTGTVTHYTRSAASFNNSDVPSGNATMTCIISQFNNIQLHIRNLNDVEY